MPARPPKMTPCVQCGESRTGSLVRPLSGKQGKPGVCLICVPRGKLTSEEWATRARQMTEAALASSTKLVPRVRQHATAAVNLERTFQERSAERALTTFLSLTALSTPRCTCCQQIDTPGNEVLPDSAGNGWCKLCSRSVFVCGRCVLHPGPVYFPALGGNEEPQDLLPTLRETSEIVVDQGDSL